MDNNYVGSLDEEDTPEINSQPSPAFDDLRGIQFTSEPSLAAVDDPEPTTYRAPIDFDLGTTAATGTAGPAGTCTASACGTPRCGGPRSATTCKDHIAQLDLLTQGGPRARGVASRQWRVAVAVVGCHVPGNRGRHGPRVPAHPPRRAHA